MSAIIVHTLNVVNVARQRFLTLRLPHTPHTGQTKAWKDGHRDRPITIDMSIIRLVRDIYSLDTLDTRLTASATPPSKDANGTTTKTSTKDGKSSDLPAGASPSKWRTAEFYSYGLILAIIIPLMYKAVWDVSQTSSPHYKLYSHLLSDGWLFGRKVDNSDGQYASFRDNIPALSVLMVIQPLLRKFYNYCIGTSSDDSPSKTLASRIRFDFISGVVYITALHGFSAFKVLAILYLNYCVAFRLPRHLIPGVTWTFNICILFANELAGGYHYTSILQPLTPFYAGAGDLGKFLDSWGGLNSRWEVLFNITILRLIAFNMDYYWSLARDRSGSPLEVSISLVLRFRALINLRRNNSILQYFLIGTVSLSLRQTTHSLPTKPTWPTSSIRHSI